DCTSLTKERGFAISASFNRAFPKGSLHRSGLQIRAPCLNGSALSANARKGSDGGAREIAYACRIMKPLLLLFFALTAAFSSAAGAVRVMTFNVRYLNTDDRGDKAWTARRDAVAEIIKKDAPDFLGTQEAFRVMLDDIKARAP